MLFIHGAPAAMPWLAKTSTPLGEWLRGLISRVHRNVVIVALANKLVRIAWATLRRGSSFDSGRLAMAAEEDHGAAADLAAASQVFAGGLTKMA